MDASRAVRCAGAALVAVVGCGGEPRGEVAGTPKTVFTEAPRRVTDRPGNLEGVVFIVEYHKITPTERRWDRSAKRFRRDLENLYRAGFRPVNLSDYLTDRMVADPPWSDLCRLFVPPQPRPPKAAGLTDFLRPPVPDSPPKPLRSLPPGAMPVVFTFDDSDITQFRFRPDGSLDPDCAVGIWSDFARKHPDFPIRATFFVLPDRLWDQPSRWRRKLALLKKWGCELGSHTWSHRRLSRMGDEQVKKELAVTADFIGRLGFKANAIATPYGVSPKNRRLLKSFWWNGKHYTFRAVLLGGGGPAPGPRSPSFNPYRLTRTLGMDRYLGLTCFLKKVAVGEVKPFVAP